MNAFKDEFSKLLQRYSSKEAAADNKTPESPIRLSNQQILDAIHEVLRVTLNINLQNAEISAMKTPVNEIIVTTPDAPEVLRLDYNSNSVLQNRFKPKKSPEASGLEISRNKSEIEDDVFSTNIASLKSDDGDLSKKLETLRQKVLKQLPEIDVNKNIILYNMVEDTHKSVMKVVHQLEDLRELLLPQARPIRRLSAIMNLPKPQQQLPSTGTSSQQRTTQRAKALRRSMHQLNEDVPVTPTSSRLSLALPPTSSTSLQAKKPAATGNVTLSATRASTGKLGPSNRSASTSVLTDTSKSAGSAAAATTSKSPSKSGLPVKNSKYAHVQSTIPKPTSSAVKRKV